MSVPNVESKQRRRPPGSVGQRERKKAKTRATIQQEALRLFREQGYDATTIEEIAEAAEVSASTVFRYFATKEDLVVSDGSDVFFVRAFRAQPPGLRPVQAMRRALHSMLGGLSATEMNAQRDRDILMVTVPELWAASLGNVKQTLGTLAELVAERTGARPSDTAVRALSGAIFGIMMDVMLRWAKQPDMDPGAELDRLLAYLDDSFLPSGA